MSDMIDDKKEFTEEDYKYIKERLNKASDELNELIKKEESYYQELSLGVEGFIDSKSGYILGYARNRESNAWKLMIQEETRNEKNPYRYWDLDRAPRTLRLSAVKHFPELRKYIYNKARQLANKMEDVLKGNNV